MLLVRATTKHVGQAEVEEAPARSGQQDRWGSGSGCAPWPSVPPPPPAVLHPGAERQAGGGGVPENEAIGGKLRGGDLDCVVPGARAVKVLLWTRPYMAFGGAGGGGGCLASGGRDERGRGGGVAANVAIGGKLRGGGLACVDIWIGGGGGGYSVDGGSSARVDTDTSKYKVSKDGSG
jgi:hypothetical protein